MADTIVSLRDTYADYFRIGAAVSPPVLTTHGDLLTKHFGSITAGNEMKPERTQPREGDFTFERADELVAFAERNGMRVRGHTLVWHSQTPDWFFESRDGNGPASRELVLERMRTHISTVAGHFRGKVYAWDVVNEAVADKGDDVLRDSTWRRLAGDDYVAKAFEFAHAADPDALLFYNDYNAADRDKRRKIHRLLEDLLRDGVPVHGVGMQAHISIHAPSLDDFRAAIELYASLGVQIHITELDMSVFAHEDTRTDLREPTAKMMRTQDERYEAFFALFREHHDVITNVTFWGVADDRTWLDNFPVRGRKNWPLLFDVDHQPKPAFDRVVRF
jgi:endo-1,4-beta-xylanase